MKWHIEPGLKTIQTQARVISADDGLGPVAFATTHSAHLVAAAPELLEALQRSLSWLSSYRGGGAMGCYDQARAAVAKALGESA